MPRLPTALACLLALSACSKIEARDLIREANAAYQAGRFEEAIEKYNASEALERDGVTMYWNRACAAESMVLKLKDPTDRDKRRQFADMALRDFQTWFDRVDQKGEEDEKQLNDHKLALLDADERCDDLLTYWFEKHRANPKEEALYGVIARQYDRCGKPAESEEWFRKRTQDFSGSVRAWHALAVRQFEPLWPQPDSGLPFNDALDGSERQRVAEEVIKTLDQATQIDPKFRDAYVWRSMAYTQRGLSRSVVENAELPEEKLEAILAREDTIAAWKQQKAVCDLEGIPDCPTGKGAAAPAPGAACCPPPPITEAELAADAETKKELEAAIAAGGTKRGKRGKRRR